MSISGIFFFCVFLQNLCFGHSRYLECQPEQVRLSFRGDGQTFVVSWTTMDPTEDSQVDYGIASASHLNETFKGFQERFVDGGSLAREEYIHRAIFPGTLPPHQQIYYRVGSDECGWSDLFWFFTFPTNKDEKWSPKIALYGDMGNINAVSLPKLQKEAQSGMYDVILHVGDFAYDMNNENGTRGDEFLRQIEPIAAYVPYMTCPGNHEDAYNFSHYKYRFTMPDWMPNDTKSSQDLSMFYSFDLGPVHFISLNTEYYYWLNYGAHSLIRQYNWLINDLKQANLPENRSKRPWIVIFGHRPMYCSSNDNDDCTHFSTRLRIGIPFFHIFGVEDLLMEYNVDLAIWAHEHDYERFWPLYNYTVMNGSLSEPYTNPGAPIHIITGSAGCQEKHDPWLPKPEITGFRSNDYGFTRMMAHNSTHMELEQVSIDQGGKVIDHIWIKKDSHEFSKLKKKFP